MIDTPFSSCEEENHGSKRKEKPEHGSEIGARWIEQEVHTVGAVPVDGSAKQSPQLHTQIQEDCLAPPDNQYQ